MDCKENILNPEIASEARIWIYQSNRKFTGEECKNIEDELNTFTSNWQAHQQDLVAQAFLKYHQFIILAVDESQTGASGCSIDTSVRFLKSIEEKFNIELFNRTQIAYMKNNEVQICSKSEFQNAINTGLINKKTLVFNNLINQYKDLQNQWLIPAEESWHQQVFKF